MKCLYCNKPIGSDSEAFVTIPNAERCGYRARLATKFVHARCYEQETIRIYKERTDAKAGVYEHAPKLLEALKGMLELESHTHRVPGTVNREWRNGIVDDARAVVTKATGASPESA